MCYELTISRIGIFVSLVEESSEKLFVDSKSPIENWGVQKFGNGLPKEYILKQYLAKLSKQFNDESSAIGVWETLTRCFDECSGFEDRSDLARSFIRPLYVGHNRNKNVKHAYVAPGKSTDITHDGIRWNVTARVSFTACAVENSGESAKLWLNLSAAPILREDQKLDELEVASIAAKMESTATHVINDLKNAYVNATMSVLSEFYMKQEIRWEENDGKLTISFSDNDKASMKALVLSTISNEWIDNENRRELSKEGAEQFKNFVTAQLPEGVSFDSRNVELALDVPDSIGIMYRIENDKANEIKLFGFARRPHPAPPPPKNDAHLQRVGRYLHSPSRPMSTYIANYEAAKFM